MPPRAAAEPWQRRPNTLVVLSGLHTTLPLSEVLACAPSRVIARRHRLLLLETPFAEAFHRLAYAALVLDFLGVGSLDRLPFAADDEVHGTLAVRVRGIPTDQKQPPNRLG